MKPVSGGEIRIIVGGSHWSVASFSCRYLHVPVEVRNSFFCDPVLRLDVN